MPDGSAPISGKRLLFMTRILSKAGQDRSFTTKDLVRLTLTSTPELQSAAQELKDFLFREIEARNLDFVAVATKGAELVEAAEAETAAIKDTLTQREQELREAQTQKAALGAELAQRPTLLELESWRRENKTLRLAVDLQHSLLRRRERTIEVLQDVEESHIKHISGLRDDKDFSDKDSEDTEIALNRTLGERNEARTQLVAALQQTEGYRQQIGQLTQSAETSERQLGELRDELAQRTRERNSEREAAKELQARLTSASQLVSQLRSFEQVATVVTNENDELRRALADNETAYARMDRAKQQEIDELQRQQNIRDERIDELQRDLAKSQQEAERLRGLLAAGQEYFGRGENASNGEPRRILVSGDFLSGGVKRTEK